MCLRQRVPKDCLSKNGLCWLLYKNPGHLTVACLLRKSSMYTKKSCKTVKTKTLRNSSLNYMKNIINDSSFHKHIVQVPHADNWPCFYNPITLKSIVINSIRFNFEVNFVEAYLIISKSTMNVILLKLQL